MELNDNKLAGSELKNLTKYKQLRTLKFAGNLVKEFSDIETIVRLTQIREIIILCIEISKRACEPWFDIKSHHRKGKL